MAYKFQTGAAVMSGTLQQAGLVTINTGLVPDGNDDAYLGTTALSFSDLFLADGAVINCNAGNSTLTGGSALWQSNVAFQATRLRIDSAADYIDVSTDLQIVAAADITLNAGGGNVKPSAESVALGVSGTGFADLFLADGAVINCNAGNSTLTGGSALWQSNVAFQATRIRIDSAADYIDVSTDLQIVAAADILLDPAGGDVKVDGNLLPNAADGGTLGSAALEWSDLYLANKGALYWGADQEVTLQHAGPNSPGLTLSATGSEAPYFAVLNSNADSNSAAIQIVHSSSSPADGDFLGALEFLGYNNVGTKDKYAHIRGEANDVTNATEDGALIFGVMIAGAPVEIFDICETAANTLTVIDGAYNFNIASHDGTNGLALAGTIVASSADELNMLDAGKAGSSVTLADADSFIIGDASDGTANTTKKVLLSDIKTYIGGGAVAVTSGSAFLYCFRRR